MRNRLGLIVLVSIFFAGILFLFSCNGTTNPPAPKPDTPTAPAKETASPLLPRYNLSGYLDILYMKAASFKLLTKRVTFRFYVEAVDTLTLRGWSSDTTVFNPPPDVFLSNGKPSTTAKFGPDSYFGNLQLKWTKIKFIQHWIDTAKTTPAYVLFVPEIPGTIAGQINYTIELANDDPRHPLFDLKKQAVPTGVNTNPSPPRKGV